MTLKEIVKTLMPKGVLRIVQKHKLRESQEKFKGLTTQQVFIKIYEESAWGKSNDPSQPFFSGTGSHDKSAVSVYIKAIQSFLGSFDRKPNAVDLGCGDFFVGSRIRTFFENYTACDIVPNLIAFNKKRYAGLNVEFRVLDLVEDELPEGDVVFIRQVLQHLSNDHIKKALPKLSASYKYLVLTEHLPLRKSFEPNLDKPAGPKTRVSTESGLVLTKPPFNLRALDERVLCEVLEDGGVIRTTLYVLAGS